jgi:DNA mismatch repair protein MutS
MDARPRVNPSGATPSDARARAEERLASAKLTPMLRQYLEVKRDHPEALILFRMGDFFETFFEDAEECARRLDITLTARSKERDVPMAGVPQHAIDGYLGRLVEQGCAVVLVDQVEDPKQAKGLVRREITRVITPGTFVDPQAPPRAASYLAAVVARGKGRRQSWGIALLDLATGDFVCANLSTVSAVREELAVHPVKEVLWPGEGPPFELEGSARWSFEPNLGAAAAEAELDRHFGADEGRGLRATAAEGARAAGVVLGYVRKTQLLPEARDTFADASIGHVDRLRLYEPGEGLVLDRQAREHLELFEARGEGGTSLLRCIDHAVTAPGGRLLARWLARPLRTPAAIAERSAAVAALVARPSAADRIREALSAAGDLERLAGRVAMGRAHPRDLRALVRTLRAAPEVLGAAADAAADAGGVSSTRLESLSQVDPCADVADRLDAALSEEPPVDPKDAGVFRSGFDAEMDRLAALALDGKKMLAELEARERQSTGISSLKVRYNRVFGYYIEVTKANLHLVPDRFVRKQTTVNAERFFTEELKTLEDQVLHADEHRIERSRHLFAELLKGLAAELPRLKVLSEALAEVDVSTGLAHLAERRGWSRPVVDDSDRLEVDEGRHPVLEQLQEQLSEPFVPNDMALSDPTRLLIITGPNMAGKSTVMRQTALIAILAHMGSFVPARKAHFGWLDRIFTRVGAGDELSRGRSTFMVEMHETARILRSATERSLVLLDEIGRGTSTFDGLSIAWAVAEHLHDRVRCKTLFATHYHELVEIGARKPRADNRHVAVREHEDDIVFLRKLEPGGANRSYGIQVARLAGLPASVVRRAKDVLEGLEARGAPAQKGLDQMDLFVSADRGRSGAPRDASDPIRERLADVDLDDLSPRHAWDVLAELKELADPSGSGPDGAN